MMKFPSDYTKHQTLKFWLPKSHNHSLGYSDGAEHEQYLKQCFSDADDLSSLSSELVNKIKDWPSEYHLSQKRANLFRPLNLNKNHRVLELGSGCGAITRYLGETVSHVTAIEGSEKRAELGALRCRDLDNVEIICSNFTDTEFNTKYDVVTLIGVLEYSGTFIAGENPYQSALELAKKHLAEDGVIIIAIENKLGLKYFDGCIEEHTGIPFKGIEGYNLTSQVATFGKSELQQLLKQSGLEHNEFLYPFPDYKLPDGVMKLDTKGLTKPVFYPWFSFNSSTDYGHMRSNGFNEYLVSKELETNGLLADFANSFLVLCGTNRDTISSLSDSNTLIEKYNVARKKPYMTKTALHKKGKQLSINKSLLFPSIEKYTSNNDSATLLQHAIEPTSALLDGHLLMEDIIRASRESIEAMLPPLKKWKSFLDKEAQQHSSGTDQYLPGDYLDCTPWNLIQIESTGELKYFDREWAYGDNISVDFVLLRGLFSIYQWLYRRTHIELNITLPDFTLRAFCEYITQQLNISLTEILWNKAIEDEWTLQQTVKFGDKEELSSYKEKFGKIPPPFHPKNLEQFYSSQSAPLFEYLDKISQENKRLQQQPRTDQQEMRAVRQSLTEHQEQWQHVQSTLAWRMHCALSAIKQRFFSKLAFAIRVRITHWQEVQQAIGWSQFLRRTPGALWRRVKRKSVLLMMQISTPRIHALLGIPFSDDSDYRKWLLLHYPNRFKLSLLKKEIGKIGHPTISIIMPVYNPSIKFLDAAIKSVTQQIYPHWELCIADDASTDPEVKSLLNSYANKDHRIKVVLQQQNKHICHTSNSALALATGEFVGLLDHDDLLSEDALFQVAKHLHQFPETDMIYSDEDKIDIDGLHMNPFFKPDWCPDSLLSRMYTCHLSVYRKRLIDKLDGFRIGFEGAQDYDLALRISEQTTQISHIDKVLYHWRVHSESTAMANTGNKPYAYEAAKKALSEALQRRNEPGVVSHVPNLLGNYQIRYKITKSSLVSIIIPTRDHSEILNTCLTSLFEKTTYENFEVIVIDNGSVEQQTVELFDYWKQKKPNQFRCLPKDIPFNYSKLNNFAVTQSLGEYLLFLNNDTEVIAENWIEGMLEQAQRKSIGAVGALLLYPDNTVQHAGVVIGLGGGAAHSHRCMSSQDPGYFAQVATINNYSAVTAACLMCRREVFDEVDGFEEALDANFNDVDFCLKIADKGYRNIYLPHVKLYHHESKSRGKEMTPERRTRLDEEIHFLATKWKKYIDHDPCYSQHLTRNGEDYRINTGL